jgi:Xaa-Pro aminopeptidase
LTTKLAHSPLINHKRLLTKLDGAGIDVLLSAAPENTYYLSGVFIRTQVSIRDRLAVAIWPASDEPTFVVCNIEESLARREGTIADLRTYVEYGQSPIARVVEVVKERGLDRKRIGIEMGFLSARFYAELRAGLPNAHFAEVDGLIESVRAVKTPAEIERIADAFRRTETAIRTAWGRSKEGDTEKMVADRMLFAMLEQGASGLRHMTLASGENTPHSHMTPGDRRLRHGDTVLTDVGGHYYGFSSDMARMGVVGKPSSLQLDEYGRYRAAYVHVLHFVKPGITGGELFAYARSEFERARLPVPLPHVGHSLTRMGGHENPMLQPSNIEPLEPGMLLAVEPTFKARPDQRYHIEDLVEVTIDGAKILTDWRSTEQMIEFATA